MAYWLDDGFDTWPETIRAGSAAAGLYVRCGSWIARNTQDGRVPTEVATMYGTTEWVAKLVAVGLWEVEPAGYRDVRYFTMGNPTADVVRKRRADAAERQRKLRERRVTRDKHGDSRGSHNVNTNVSPRSPALPPSKEGQGRAPALPPGAPHTPDDPRRSPLVDRPHPVAKPPDLTDIRNKLRADSAKARANNGRRGERAFDELVAATDPPATLAAAEPED